MSEETKTYYLQAGEEEVARFGDLRMPDLRGGLWIGKEGAVNLTDFCSALPGSIVRVSEQGALRYIPLLDDAFERVAGMISDAS